MSGHQVTTPISRRLTALERKGFTWLESEPLKKITSILNQECAGCARFVGGCVRDGLLNAGKGTSQMPADIDLATQLDPQTVTTVLRAQNIKVVPTGIDHGTVTAICDRQVVEITTLRRDVTTDGRRATIAYTDDWNEDAQRRDFTINALYLSPTGILYDPVGGLDDVNSRTVRFIGDPDSRIREDYLRILRFFRFSARFSSQFNGPGLTAISANLDGIASLSRERVGAEMLKILTLPSSVLAVQAMEQSGVLHKIWPHNIDIEAAIRFRKEMPTGHAISMLGVLFSDHIEGLADRLRLSNGQSAELSNAVNDAGLLQSINTIPHARAILYRIGRIRWDMAIPLVCALYPDAALINHEIPAQIADWQPPEFAVSGGTLVAAGIEPGPAISTLLRAIEERWIAEGFPDDETLQTIVAQSIATHQ